MRKNITADSGSASNNFDVIELRPKGHFEKCRSLLGNFLNASLHYTKNSPISQGASPFGYPRPPQNITIMGYVVLHLLKPAGTDASMTAHIERTVMPANADPNRTHLNRTLIEYPEGVNDRTEAIQQRLDTAGLTRQIGKNQRRAFNVMLSGSPEDMKRIADSGKLDWWCDDNLEWLRKTYGKENVVSAVLHLDETSPHIHATVVPIVTTERKKKKSELNAKKRYRTKRRDAPRLCLDDVMSRDKLKEYQTTYAEAMAKYGLRRGVDGSEARHISTTEFYKGMSLRNEVLKEDIGELETQKEQVNRELDKVKSEVSREKFKNSAANVGTALMDGVGSLLGGSKTKRLQSEIEELRAENAELNENFNNEIKQLKTQLRTTEAEHKSAIGKLSEQLEKIYDLFPHIKNLLNWENFLTKIGLPKDVIKRLFNREELTVSGELYSTEHSMKFTAENAKLKLEQDKEKPSNISLNLNGTDIHDWFKQKKQEFLKSIGINVQTKENRGLKRQ